VQATQGPDDPNRVAVLDSLRGICALLVALHHFRANGRIVDLPLVQNAFLFVDMFFALSGFVIANAYFNSLIDGASVRSFVAKRFARLYPLHIATIAAFLALEIVFAPALAVGRSSFSGAMSIDGLVLNVLLLNSIGLTDGLTWNYPSWSIGAEFMTYLVFAGAVCAFAKRSLFLFLALAPGGIAALLWLSPDNIDATSDLGLVRCIAGFSMGVLTWRLVTSGPVLHKSQRLSASVFTVMEVVLCAAVIAFVWFVGHGTASLLSPVLFALVVGCFFFQKGAVSGFLRTPWLLWLGAISYSIYMVHALIASRLFSGGLKLGEQLTSLALLDERGLFGATAAAGDMMTIVYLILVVASASLTYRHIEVPGQRAARRAFGIKERSVLLQKPSNEAPGQLH